MKISILIASCKRTPSSLKFLPELTGQVVAQEEGRAVLIVDNNSTDGTSDAVAPFVQENPHRFRYFLETRQGKSAALNTGIKEARGEILAFTDDDCLPNLDWLSSIAGEFSTDPLLGAIGGRVELYDKQDKPVSIRTCTQRTLISTPSQLFSLLIGCNMAVHRRVCERVEEFDTLLGPGIRTRALEDMDFLYRISSVVRGLNRRGDSSGHFLWVLATDWHGICESRRLDMNPTVAEYLRSGEESLGLLAGAAPSRSALIPDVGVLALVPDLWHWQWQPRHQVMTRLARYFPVVWMNPAEYWRKSLRLRTLLPSQDGVPIPESDFVVHTASPFLPLLYSPRKLAKYTLRKRLETARQTLVRKGCTKVALYLWRPEFAAALDQIPADLSCYHIDDEYTFSTVDTPISEEERNLIARVDQVFIHSPALLEKKGKINPHTSFTPNGVDFDAYAQPVQEPDDLRKIPHPRIGYSGHIKRQLDWQLLRDLTARHPNWFFVFVGSANAHSEILGHVEELSRRKNVRFLGSKTALQLAAYPQHFDVCVMPYRNDDYTKYIYPLKLHEYLASGRPVVGTPIPSLVAFRDSVRLPENAEQWTVAIAQSLEPMANTMESRAARQAVAKSHDWNILVRQIAQTMANRLGPAYAALLERNI